MQVVFVKIIDNDIEPGTDCPKFKFNTKFARLKVSNVATLNNQNKVIMLYYMLKSFAFDRIKVVFVL